MPKLLDLTTMKNQKHAKCGVLYIKEGNFREAVSCFEEQLKKETILSPTYPKTLYNLAISYLNVGQLEEARSYLKTCLQILEERKDSAWLDLVYNALGNLGEQTKEYETAITCYRQALELTKNSHRYVIAYNMAALYLRTKKLEEAKHYFQKTLRWIEDSKLQEPFPAIEHLYKSLLGLSSLFRQEGRLDDAKMALEECGTLLRIRGFLQTKKEYYWQERAALTAAMNNREIPLANCLYTH